MKTLPIIALLWSAAVGFAASQVNYDTAWTFVYDGGKANSGRNINDYLYDVKVSPDGYTFCIGETRDTSEVEHFID
jgi:hypothetical protein